MQSSPSRERPIDKFAVSLASTLALGTLFGALALLGRLVDGSWSAALAPFAAGAAYAGGALGLVFAARYRQGRAALGRLGVLSLPLLGALAGAAWAAVDLPRGGWITALAYGAMLGASHAALGRRVQTTDSRRDLDAPAA